MKTITKRIHQYRTMKAYFIGFDIPVDNLVVESYTKENGQSRMKGLSVFSFESISYLRTSEKGFIHAVAWLGNVRYQLVLKQKPIKKINDDRIEKAIKKLNLVVELHKQLMVAFAKPSDKNK